MATVFFSYSHKDEDLRNQLETQLAMLRRQGVISTWHDRRIIAGEEFAQVIDDHINADDIILLLASADFLASDYCYELEMQRAMERHEAGEAVVIPVILRACDWQGAPFGKLQATPTDARPVTQWPDRDQAFLEVARAIRRAAERFNSATVTAVAPTVPSSAAAVLKTEGHRPGRSSNLRVTRHFTERDKDAFQDEAFEYLAKYFENSLAELSDRNVGIEGSFRRIDANRFAAVVYREGKAATRCTVFMGAGVLGGGIAYSNSDIGGSNSFNECLSVQADDQSLFLHSMGMSSFTTSRREDEKLSMEGAAELYWELFIEPLQRR